LVAKRQERTTGISACVIDDYGLECEEEGMSEEKLVKRCLALQAQSSQEISVAPAAGCTKCIVKATL